MLTANIPFVIFVSIVSIVIIAIFFILLFKNSDGDGLSVETLVLYGLVVVGEIAAVIYLIIFK